ncbi:hypothetical protein AMTRI_Chr01g129720 [Amborella trichopoda]
MNLENYRSIVCSFIDWLPLYSASGTKVLKNIFKQSMTKEYELSTYDSHELNYNQIALGRLPISVVGDYTIQTIINSNQSNVPMNKPLDTRTITNYNFRFKTDGNNILRLTIH